MEGPPSQLLEHVAQTTADEIMQGHTSVRGVTLEIQKPHVAIPGVVSSLGMYACCTCTQAISLQYFMRFMARLTLVSMNACPGIEITRFK